jgi:hypothetical protein
MSSPGRLLGLPALPVPAGKATPYDHLNAWVGATIAYCRGHPATRTPSYSSTPWTPTGMTGCSPRPNPASAACSGPGSPLPCRPCSPPTRSCSGSPTGGAAWPHVLTAIGELRDRGVRVKSLTETFDLDTGEGRFMFAILAAAAAAAAAAEYELELRAGRQAEGIAATRAPPGRRPDSARQEAHRPPESGRPGGDRRAPPPGRRRRHGHPGRPHPEDLPLHRVRRARQHTLTPDESPACDRTIPPSGPWPARLTGRDGAPAAPNAAAAPLCASAQQISARRFGHG